MICRVFSICALLLLICHCLSTTVAIAIPSSDFDPFSSANNAAIVFPDEKPEANAVQVLPKGKSSYQIVFPNSDSENLGYEQRPRPRLHTKKKPMRQRPFGRPSADSVHTPRQPYSTYYSYSPTEESAAPAAIKTQQQMQRQQFSKTRVNNLRKKHDQSVQHKVDTKESEDNTDELVDIFIQWVQKCAPLPAQAKITSAKVAKPPEKDSSTGYSLGVPLNDLKCPEGQKRTPDGECREIVPDF